MEPGFPGEWVFSAKMLADLDIFPIIRRMAQNRLVTLYNKEADEFITTFKSGKKGSNIKLSLKKYSKKLRKRVLFTQTKKLFKKKKA